MKPTTYFATSELTCVSVYRWRATGADQVTSTQVTLPRCIVGWTDIFTSLFLYSHLSHSHNSTFCLATAIPQMWSGLQRTITAQHQVSMTTTPYLICISCLHYLPKPNMVTLLLSPPLSASPPPCFLNNTLFPSIFTTVCTLFVSNVYTHTLWTKRGSDCDIRPVCRLRDKQWNRFCKSGSGGVVKTAVEGLKKERRLSLCYLNPPMAGT